MRGRVAAFMALPIVASACAVSALAQALEVSPVSVVLPPGQRTAVLTVANLGAAPTVVQVRLFRWREDNGTATLTETTALAASPPFADIAPDQPQSIRLLLREPPGATEETYRLLIDQLPPPTASSGLRIALRISLPIFAQPAAGEPDLDWKIVSNRTGATLHVQNRGTRHATIVNVQANTKLAVQTSTHPYVLPGAVAEWPIIGARLPSSGSVRLKITSDTGALDAIAPIVSAPP